MLHFKIRAALWAILCFASLGFKESQSADQLSAAVQSFIHYRTTQNYNGVWSMTSRGLKQGNDFNEARYVRELTEAGFRSKSIVVKKNRMSHGAALVTVAVTYVDKKDQLIGTATEEWKFVYEGGTWVFDEYKTLSEP